MTSSASTVDSHSVDAVASPSGSTVPSPRTKDTSSPCVDICELDSDFVCIGCGRTIDEVLNWPGYTDEQKKAVLDRLFGAKLQGFAAGN
jgi:hypothetical protein